tara:strand:- start:46 stop:504 length:459 start_codon:yes stop_codon:yes gene_type:complete
METIKNILAFWPNFFRELRLLYRYSRAVKSIQTELEDQGLRIDWLGRVYTVVNLAEEYHNQPEMMQQSIVFKELKPTSDILMKYGLSEHAYPLIEKLDEKDSCAFLVVLYPETDYFNFWRTLWNSLFLFILIQFVLLSIKYAPILIELIASL